MIMQEMCAYEEQVNLLLFDNIVRFVISSVDFPTYSLLQRIIFPINVASKNSMQKDYGFLYLGELLERYEERFGMSDADFRAIALALGYLSYLVTDDMVVGTQKTIFLRQLERRAASGDIYLSGALYLLHEGQRGAVSYRQVADRQYEKLEDLIFVLSIAPDFEEAFCHLKPQLLELLTSKRNIQLFGNTQF